MDSQFSKPRVLITGISGFTGHYLRKAFEKAGYDVYGTANKNRTALDKIYQVNLDVKDEIKNVITMVQPNIVIHLAAISFVAHSDIASIYRTNVVGTRNLLQAIEESQEKPSNILLASSANVYGQVTEGMIDENVLPNPLNDYAVSKLSMEYVAKLWSGRLPITIVRPFNYTGVGQSLDFLLPKIVDHFKRGVREIELGNLNVARDFSDVRSVAEIYVKLIQNNIRGETINICSGEFYALQEILVMMEQVAGYKIDIKTNPAFVRQNEVKCLFGCNKKLLSLVGRIEKISMLDTLKWMYEN